MLIRFSLLTIALATAPVTSLAACPTAKVTELKDLTPISSHYTLKLLERIDAGISYTPAAASSTDGFLDSIFSVIWNWYVKNSVSDTVNLYQQGILQTRNLEEVTTCMNADILIVEAKMEEVRCLLNDAYANDDGQRIFLLRSVLHFAEDGVNALINGGTDPFFENVNWGRLQWWDDDANVFCRMPQVTEAAYCSNCCESTTIEVCTENGGIAYYEEFGLQTCLADGGQLPDGVPDPGPGLCPFTSDYLPPVTAGYGCDKETIEEIVSQAPSLEPVKTEYEGLEKLITDRDDFIDLATPIKEQRIKIDEFMNKEPLDLTKFGQGHSDNRTHIEVSGCIDPFGSGTAASTTTTTGSVNLNPIYTQGGTIIETRGTFWFSKNEPKLTRMLIEKAARTEQFRELPDYLKNEFELKDQGSPFLNVAETLRGLMNEGLRLMIRPAVEQTSIEQARKRASTFSFTVDSTLQLQDAFSNIRGNIRDLTETNDMRTFGTGFAWYIRRSCTERPCNKLLDTVLKVLLTDECFPYADGTYKDEDEYEKCKQEAGL